MTEYGILSNGTADVAMLCDCSINKVFMHCWQLLARQRGRLAWRAAIKIIDS